MQTTEPLSNDCTDAELMGHLDPIAEQRAAFQKLWHGGLRDKWTMAEATAWEAYRAGWAARAKAGREMGQ